MAPELVVPAARPVFWPEDRAAITALIDEALSSGSLTLGPLTSRFEAAFATRHQAKHAVATSSGTAALEIIFRCLGVAGQRVVVPANTFFATAAAVMHAGGTPVFADVDPQTMMLSADTLRAVLDRPVAGVVLVHIGGAVSPASAEIAALCAERGLFLVEDAAHAHGSSIAGRSAGSFGTAAAYSFYPTKVITSGEGGMITTSDEELAARAGVFRDQGKAGFLGGDHIELGYSWRMSELHAAVGLVQLARLDEFIARRQEVAKRYDRCLEEFVSVSPLPLSPSSSSNVYKYIAMPDAAVDRATLKKLLREECGVSLSGEVYASPLHAQPVFAGIERGPLPNADDVCSRHICLPVHSDMTSEEVDQVTASLDRCLPRASRG